MRKNKYKLDEKLKLYQITDGILYHYTNAAGLLGILQNKSFWVSKSDFLNDSSEISYIDTIIKSICKDIFNDENQLIYKMILKEVHINNFGKDLATNVKKQNYYILSLTENPDSLALWSSYSNFFGYNIGVDGSDLVKLISNSQNRTPINLHGKVIYDKALQYKIIKEEIDKSKILQLYNKYSKSKNAEIYHQLKEEIFLLSVPLCIYGLFFKDPLFCQEEEYRIIFFYIKDDKILTTKLTPEIKFRDRDGIIIPYIDLPIINNQGHLPVKEITIGPKNNIDIAEYGIDFLLYKLDKKDVIIRRSKIPLRY